MTALSAACRGANHTWAGCVLRGESRTCGVQGGGLVEFEFEFETERRHDTE